MKILNSLKKKINRKIYTPYLNCSTLPVKKFYKVIDTKELRHLLKTDNLPVYDLTYLSKVWESIMQEYQQLTNSLMYTNNLFKTGYNLQKNNRLNGMICCYHMLR